MKILFYVNTRKHNAAKTAKRAGGILSSFGVQCFIGTSNADLLSDHAFDLLVQGDQRRMDFFIAVGGDGTIMDVAKKAVKWDKPLLGINAGRLGFMAGLEALELNKLFFLTNGNYEEQKRMLLEVKYSQENSSILAVNDLLITKPILNSMIEVAVACNTKRVIEYRADSVLFSTPTGSTAYALSNGGPVADPNLEFISMSPICPHSLLSRTYLFDSSKALSACLKKGNLSTAHLLIDGNLTADLTSGQEIVISKSEKYLRLIMLHQREFYQVVGKKFIKNM